MQKAYCYCSILIENTTVFIIKLTDGHSLFIKVNHAIVAQAVIANTSSNSLRILSSTSVLILHFYVI